MHLKFTKMHGLGNDFVVINAISQAVALTSEQIRFLADRHFGVGCDQVLLVESARSKGVDFAYRIYNADGGEVEQCGNGARCFMRFVRDQGLSAKNELVVETMYGVIRPRLEQDGQVTVSMGVPRLLPQDIPFLADQEALSYALEVEGKTYQIGAVSMGNPHAVLQVEDVQRAPVSTLGPLIERHARFPRGANAGFMRIVDRANIELRVFERGAGETLACGSGACAAMVVARLRGQVDDKVTVALPGGRLQIAWRGAGEEVHMTGPAVSVYEGEIEL
ncbi:MAG: diaminopimelate epimerase [Gammaproteobacteria bacterium]|nr:MAG: diaminopimelate epimerase [Gammaproteobacteria bacterium]